MIAISPRINERNNESDDDEDDDASYDLVVVFLSLDRNVFRRWLERFEGELKKWEYEPLTSTTGRIVVYCSMTTISCDTSASVSKLQPIDSLQKLRQYTRVHYQVDVFHDP